MIHAREDYKSIQDLSGKIPENEPVFLLRSTDKFTVLTIKYWVSLVRDQADSEEKLKIANLAYNHVNKILDWQIKHGIKFPDLPEPKSEMSKALDEQKEIDRKRFGTEHQLQQLLWDGQVEQEYYNETFVGIVNLIKNILKDDELKRQLFDINLDEDYPINEFEGE